MAAGAVVEAEGGPVPVQEGRMAAAKGMVKAAVTVEEREPEDMEEAAVAVAAAAEEAERVPVLVEHMEEVMAAEKGPAPVMAVELAVMEEEAAVAADPVAEAAVATLLENEWRLQIINPCLVINVYKGINILFSVLAQ